MDDYSINIIAKDGTRFSFKHKIVDYSNFIKTTIEDTSPDEDIPVDVSSFCIKKIKEFFEHHDYRDIKNVKKPIKISNFATLATEWDNNFLKSLDEDQLADLLMSANYLQCEILFEYCCAFIACQFKDLTIDDLKKKYNITEDLTPELEEQIKKEYAPIFKDLIPDN